MKPMTAVGNAIPIRDQVKKKIQEQIEHLLRLALGTCGVILHSSHLPLFTSLQWWSNEAKKKNRAGRESRSSASLSGANTAQSCAWTIPASQPSRARTCSGKRRTCSGKRSPWAVYGVRRHPQAACGAGWGREAMTPVSAEPDREADQHGCPDRRHDCRWRTWHATPAATQASQEMQKESRCRRSTVPAPERTPPSIAATRQ